MYILTDNNLPYNIDSIPDEVEDLRYCVLDYTSADVCYTHMPLIFLESFNAPSAILQVDDVQIEMPLDWSVLVGEPSQGDMEIIPLANLNDRGFETLLYNPLKGYMPTWAPIQIINVFVEVKWFFPKLKFGHILTMPIENKTNPLCGYFVKETNKIPDVIDIGDIIL